MMSSIPHMVVGLAFTPDRKKVALVHKTKGPPAVIGRWNGVGGKIEEGELAVTAMRREFREETGVDIPEVSWLLVAHVKNPEYVLFFYEYEGVEVEAVQTMEEERIELFDSVDLLLWDDSLMPNIKWMVGMLCDSEFRHSNPMIFPQLPAKLTRR